MVPHGPPHETDSSAAAPVESGDGRTHGDGQTPDGGPTADGGRETAATTTLSEEELRRLISDAVEDAILGAIGTVLLMAIGLVFVAVGAVTAVEGSTTTEWLLGAAFLLFGGYVAARAVRLLPPLRAWVA